MYKTSLYLVVFISLCACSGQRLSPVKAEPRSKIHFVTTNLTKGIRRLNIYDVSEDCVFTQTGYVIRLQRKSNQAYTYITADTYTYFNVLLHLPRGLGMSVIGDQKVSFYPEQGKEYTVEVITHGSAFRADVFEGPPSNKVRKLLSHRPWENLCKKSNLNESKYETMPDNNKRTEGEILAPPLERSPILFEKN